MRQAYTRSVEVTRHAPFTASDTTQDPDKDQLWVAVRPKIESQDEQPPEEDRDRCYEVNAPAPSHRLRYDRPEDNHLGTPANILAGCTNLSRKSTYPTRILTLRDRLMSDYEVTLVNDNMYVPPSITFQLRILDLQGSGKNSMSDLKVPKKVSSAGAIRPSAGNRFLTLDSPVSRRTLEDPRRTTRPIPLQEPEHWLRQQDIPPEYRRAVSTTPVIVTGQKLTAANRSGSVCLDVINQTWSPMFDMINIFEVFLPQLLRYPNPTDPLNGEAASLLMREPKTYEAKVKEYVSKYATREAIDDNGAESDDDDDMSSVASFGSDDNDEAAGQMEEL
ncbi:hypothetical protein V491_03975 [Pseudogymnoascus sp. VKM F-3775]|nr:hypothetical protein V491_03975 [Pseudogymnoascus sp. VKM F-3775]